jgi:hypothetical protein
MPAVNIELGIAGMIVILIWIQGHEKMNTTRSVVVLGLIFSSMFLREASYIYKREVTKQLSAYERDKTMFRYIEQLPRGTQVLAWFGKYYKMYSDKEIDVEPYYPLIGIVPNHFKHGTCLWIDKQRLDVPQTIPVGFRLTKDTLDIQLYVYQE